MPIIALDRAGDAQPTALRAAARGVVAAMAMTGMRTVSQGFGLLREAPPEEVARRGAPLLFARIPGEHQPEAIQLAHWAYGAAAGAVYGLLPDTVRRPASSGAAYGLAIWLFFETVLAPVLGLRVRERTAREHVMLAADHLLYGLVVGARAPRV